MKIRITLFCLFLATCACPETIPKNGVYCAKEVSQLACLHLNLDESRVLLPVVSSKQVVDDQVFQIKGCKNNTLFLKKDDHDRIEILSETVILFMGKELYFKSDGSQFSNPMLDGF